MNIGDLHKVWEIKTLKGKPGEEQAHKMLEKIAKQVQPIMHKRKWRIKLLSEFYPSNPSLLGLNVGAGIQVKLRLRSPNRVSEFYPYDQVLDTMLHELCLNAHGHHSNFYMLWDELRKECKELMAKGITGFREGFDLPGRRLGGDLHKVWKIKALKGMPGEEQAHRMLEKIAKQVQPIMHKHKWSVKLLSEFYPNNHSLLGLNDGAGIQVKLRLRRPNRVSEFYPYDQVLDTMLHELCLNAHGPRNSNFYKLWDELRKECKELIAKEITGSMEGFDLPGRRLDGDLHKVWEIKALKEMPGEEQAHKMLEKIAKQVQPIMLKHKWRVKLLSEFYPNDPCLMGLNVGAGNHVKLRLRKPNWDLDFCPFDLVLDAMLHELCHNAHSLHDSNFYKLWDELRKECEGFDLPGGAWVVTFVNQAKRHLFEYNRL